MPGFPTGTITFMLTEVEGSARLWSEQGQAMRQSVSRYEALFVSAIEPHEGAIVRTRGEADACFAVFARASDAVAAAREIQSALVAELWPEEARLRVRIGIHTGEAQFREGDYYGSAVNRCARIRAIAHGGQVLLSEATHRLVCDDLPAAAGLRDLGAHRLKDLQRPEQIYQLLHPSLPADFPPLISLDARPNNLPQQLTSFIGRDREMSEVKRLIAADRLVTLLGAGGLGKTRLALQVAAELLDEHPDGVWLVELAAVLPRSDLTVVGGEVARVLGVREQPGLAQRDVLIDHLRTQRCLILLDNCEHVVGPCAALAADLLRACGNLRVLATSREVLGIPGEAIYRIPSLSLPADDQRPTTTSSDQRPSAQEHRSSSYAPGTHASGAGCADGRSSAPDSLLQSEAVRLFVDRAAAGHPRFALTEQNAAAVARICHRLDGLPLAIELAAARVKLLSAEQIDARLNDRFRLLIAGSRTALPRQQTLRALIDWSYDLLSEVERALLRRLAVFAGGFILEAAVAVCAADDLDEYEVLDLLGQLVDKSLVVAEEPETETRYRLLETIREYAREHLRQAGEEEAVRTRHYDWFLQLAEDAEPALFRGPDEEWLQRLDREHDNLRAAFEWSTASRGAETSLRLGAALWRFWAHRGYLAEGRERLATLHRDPAPSAPPAVRAQVLHGAGLLAHWQGDYTAAQSHYEESLAIRRAIDDRQAIGDTLNNLGSVAMDRGDYATARRLYEESLDLRREQGDRPGVAHSLQSLGDIAIDQGEYETARDLYEQSLVIRRQLVDRPEIANCLNSLGNVAFSLGDVATARAQYEASLAIRRQLGIKRGVAVSLSNLGSVAHAQGDTDAVSGLYEESLRLFRELGDRPHVAALLANLGLVALSRGEAEVAAGLCRESLLLFAQQQNRPGIVACLEGLAAVALHRAEHAQAVLLLGAAAALQEELGALMPPAEQEEHDRHLDAARAALGDAAFTAAWEQGRAMPLDEVIPRATEADEPPGPGTSPR